MFDDGTRYDWKALSNAYNAANTKIQKHYTAEKCQPKEKLKLLAEDRTSGLTRWIAVKILVQRGALPKDLTEDATTF